jgi:tetratricopeptide (TPR) repeat protein
MKVKVLLMNEIELGNYIRQTNKSDLINLIKSLVQVPKQLTNHVDESTFKHLQVASEIISLSNISLYELKKNFDFIELKYLSLISSKNANFLMYARLLLLESTRNCSKCDSVSFIQDFIDSEHEDALKCQLQFEVGNYYFCIGEYELAKQAFFRVKSLMNSSEVWEFTSLELDKLVQVSCRFTTTDLDTFNNYQESIQLFIKDVDTHEIQENYKKIMVQRAFREGLEEYDSLLFTTLIAKVQYTMINNATDGMIIDVTSNGGIIDTIVGTNGKGSTTDGTTNININRIVKMIFKELIVIKMTSDKLLSLVEILTISKQYIAESRINDFTKIWQSVIFAFAFNLDLTTLKRVLSLEFMNDLRLNWIFKSQVPLDRMKRDNPNNKVWENPKLLEILLTRINQEEEKHVSILTNLVGSFPIPIAPLLLNHATEAYEKKSFQTAIQLSKMAQICIQNTNSKLVDKSLQIIQYSLISQILLQCKSDSSKNDFLIKQLLSSSACVCDDLALFREIIACLISKGYRHEALVFIQQLQQSNTFPRDLQTAITHLSRIIIFKSAIIESINDFLTEKEVFDLAHLFEWITFQDDSDNQYIDQVYTQVFTFLHSLNNEKVWEFALGIIGNYLNETCSLGIKMIQNISTYKPLQVTRTQNDKIKQNSIKYLENCCAFIIKNTPNYPVIYLQADLFYIKKDYKNAINSYLNGMILQSNWFKNGIDFNDEYLLDSLIDCYKQLQGNNMLKKISFPCASFYSQKQQKNMIKSIFILNKLLQAITNH